MSENNHHNHHGKRRLISQKKREQLEEQAERLRAIDHSLKEQEELAPHTSFKIGGPADFYAEPEDLRTVIALIQQTNVLNIPLFYLGAGTNLLVSDQGIRGLVLNLKKFNSIEILGEIDELEAWPLPERPTKNRIEQQVSKAEPEHIFIRAEAGVSLKKLAEFCLEHALTGLEFAHGIPGSLGGAIYMNAGAYGGMIADQVVATRYIDRTGNVRIRSGSASDFGYRHSYFMDEDALILDVILVLRPGDASTIRQNMLYLLEKRKNSQPLEYPSAGSVFKRPEGHYAGKLITDAGLKGCRIGGAEVSQKHAGFIINPERKATAHNVSSLISHIQTTVKQEFGVDLELELKFVGDWGGSDEQHD